MEKESKRIVEGIYNFLKTQKVKSRDLVINTEQAANFKSKPDFLLFWRHDWRLIIFLVNGDKITIRVYRDLNEVAPYWFKGKTTFGMAKKDIVKLLNTPDAEELAKMGYLNLRICCDEYLAINACHLKMVSTVFPEYKIFANALKNGCYIHHPLQIAIGNNYPTDRLAMYLFSNIYHSYGVNLKPKGKTKARLIFELNPSLTNGVSGSVALKISYEKFYSISLVCNKKGKKSPPIMIKMYPNMLKEIKERPKPEQSIAWENLNFPSANHFQKLVLPSLEMLAKYCN